MPSATMKEFGRSAARAICRMPLVKPVLQPLSRAGLLPYSVWMRLPVNGTIEVSFPGRRFRYAALDGDELGRILYWKGSSGFEGETVIEFSPLAASARVVIDVGACTGFYTLLALASNPQARVIAFEPLRANRERLELNLRLNGWHSRCEIRSECVAESCRSGKLHVPLAAPGATISSSSLNTSGFRGLPGQLIDTTCVSLDIAIPADMPVDLIKIDVEGFEGAVFEGMQRIMREQRPAIIFECSEETPANVGPLLHRFDYDLYHIAASGPAQISDLKPDDRFRNYLAKSRTRAAAPLSGLKTAAG